MQTLPLNELILVGLTRSDRVLHIGLQQLVEPNRYKPKDWANQYKQAVCESIFDMGNHQYRWDDIDKAIDICWQPFAHGGGYQLTALTQIASQYLQFKGDHYAVAANECTGYQALINRINPGVLIASQWVKQINQRQLSIAALKPLLARQCPLGFQPNDPDLVYADNHVHYGGVHGAEVLARLLFDRPDRLQLQKLNLPRVTDFSLINNDNYSVAKLIGIYRLLFDQFCQQCFAASTDCTLSSAGDFSQTLKQSIKQATISYSSPWLYKYSRISATANAKLQQNNHTDIQKTLLEMNRQFHQGNSHQAMVAFACALLLQLSRPDCCAPMATLSVSLLQLINILRGYVVMSGVGLTHFVAFFQSDVRRFNKDKDDSQALSWLLRDSNKVALKVSPPQDNLDFLADVANDAAQQNQQLETLHSRMQYCLHFVRDYGGGINGKSKNHKRRDINEQALRLRRLLKTQHRHIVSINPSKLRRTPDETLACAIPQWVKGLDVAGNENHFSIDVFAPALRFLREKPIETRQLDGNVSLSRRKHLSIHAGEDYSSLVSGLRQMDETVYYCNMGHGDRIGHGLALGVMPTDWAERQQMAFVAPEEALWNTVWLAHYALELSVEQSVANQLVAHYQRQLACFQQHYFEQVFEPQVLWRYWQNRGNCRQHQQWLRRSSRLHDRQYWILDNSDQICAKQIAEIRFALQKLHNKPPICIHLPVSQTRNRQQFTRQQSNNERWMLPEELTFIQLLQDHLMMKYDYQGIVLEACPSSNIALGRFEHYHQHPIFRWIPPDDSLFADENLDPFGIRQNKAIGVCVNTDDPGIFPTKIEQEYHLLANAAKQHFGLSSQTTQNWIERLRLLGLRAFDG